MVSNKESLTQEILGRKAHVEPGLRTAYGKVGRFLTSNLGSYALLLYIPIFLVIGLVVRQVLWLPWIVESFGQGDKLIEGSFLAVIFGGIILGGLYACAADTLRIVNFWRWRKITLGVLAKEHLRAGVVVSDALEVIKDRQVRKAIVRQMRLFEAICHQEAQLTERLSHIQGNAVDSSIEDAVMLVKEKRSDLVSEAVRILHRLKATAQVEEERARRDATIAAVTKGLPDGRVRRRLSDMQAEEFLEGRISEAEAYNAFRGR